MRHDSPFNEVIEALFGPQQVIRSGRGRVTEIDDLPAVILDIPGRGKSDVRVYTKKGALHIEVNDVEGRKGFTERYLLDKNHDPQKVKANLKRGVLTVTVGYREDSGPEEHVVDIE